MTGELPESEEPQRRDSAAKPGLLERLGLINVVRLAIGMLGLAGFVVGVLVAWKSQSATTLLVVSAVLLVLGALGLDWNAIRGTYGGWTVEFLRNVEQRIENVAASGDIPAVLREELEQVKAQVAALTPRERSRRRSAPPISDESIEALVQEMFTTRATHAFQGRDAVRLSLRVPAGRETRYRCTVRSPSGSSHTAVAREAILPGVSSATGPRTYALTYPDEFVGSEPLGPGQYEVEWRSAPLIDPVGQSSLLATLGQTMGRPVATDAFTIPDPSNASDVSST